MMGMIVIQVHLYSSNKKAIIDIEDVEIVAGRRCSLNRSGYVKLSEGNGNRRNYLHRLIIGVSADISVDHINGNKLDNRRSNLRIATKAENGWNRGKASHNTSGFKGVYFDKGTGRWRSSLRANKKVYRIGRFDTVEEAALAYDNKARELHGQFARLNFPDIGRGCGE